MNAMASGLWCMDIGMWKIKYLIATNRLFPPKLLAVPIITLQNMLKFTRHIDYPYTFIHTLVAFIMWYYINIFN